MISTPLSFVPLPEPKSMMAKDPPLLADERMFVGNAIVTVRWDGGCDFSRNARAADWVVSGLERKNAQGRVRGSFDGCVDGQVNLQLFRACGCPRCSNVFPLCRRFDGYGASCWGRCGWSA